MEVLLFQIGVFIVIFFVGAFGKKPRIYICIAIGIFTLFAVFTTGLAILQFITIFIAYSVSENLADPNSDDGSYDFSGCFKTLLIIIISLIAISFLIKTCSSKDDSSDKALQNDSVKSNNDNLLRETNYDSDYNSVE